VEAVVYREMREVEDRHWWFAGLRRLVMDAAAPVLAARRDARVLDAGCGTGGVMAMLRTATAATIVGVDLSPLAVSASRERRAGPVLQASLEALPFDGASFDLVTCLDVLYIAGLDDRRAVRELHRVLRPSGTVIVNLAAFDWLRGAHDVMVHTERRYSRARLRRLLADAGFRVARLTYWNAALFPLLAAWRPLTRLLRSGASVRSDLSMPPASVNAALTLLLAGEVRASRHVPLPFGSSVFAVGVKE
jgi:ubiquinone/menaquinone biosynthesis C-methylase UbiE